MRRGAFHFAAGLSLLMMIACLYAWVRSTAGAEGLTHRNDDRMLALSYNHGRFTFVGLWFDLDESTRPFLGVSYGWDTFENRFIENSSVRDEGISFAGFGYTNQDSKALGGQLPGIRRVMAVYIPIWFVLLVLAAPPVWWWRGHGRRKRREVLKHWACADCGYDFRGFQGDKCPECGADRSPENRLIRQLEAAGWTVGRIPFLTDEGERYRLDAWRTNENPSGAYEGEGELHTAEAGDMVSAAQRLAQTLGVTLDDDGFADDEHAIADENPNGSRSTDTDD